jgi:hypothetical protein
VNRWSPLQSRAADGPSSGRRQTHVAHLLAKLGARDRGQLVITAYQAGLLDA